MRQQAMEKIGARQEVGVEDGHELAARNAQPGFQRTRLVARTILTVEILDVDAMRGVAPDRELRDFSRFIRRVVQDLDLEQLRRVIEAANRVDQPIGDVHLVVDRQLNGDDRKRVKWSGF